MLLDDIEVIDRKLDQALRYINRATTSRFPHEEIDHAKAIIIALRALMVQLRSR